MKEEKKLVRQCKANSPKAFDRLYDKYSPVLFGICLRYGADRSVAEDMLQESFMTIFSKIEGYRFEGSFEGWLKRITVNTAINILRKRNKHLHLRFDNDVYFEPSSTEVSPVDRMSEQEILKCIQELPLGYRTVFNMYVIEGYKHKEIAECLGISENTSRTQLAKARKALQIEIKRINE
jgi:RNA polymerase sigma-70 factor (ECF subfamily)